MAQQSTFLEELMAAGRGIAALLLADRKATRYFDFSQRGLAGSLIALALVALLNGLLPLVLADGPGGIFKSVVTFVIVQALQMLLSVLVLRQVGRMDALVPYLVAENWATLFLQLISAALVAAGLDAITLLVIVGAIYLEVNIARFVVTLTPLQIAMLIIAQVVGLLIGSFVINLIFPLPPDAVQQILQQASLLQ